MIVCGGRNYADREAVARALAWLHDSNSKAVVVDGAASGADTLAHEEAVKLGMTTERHPAQWDKHGRAAGMIRNRHMLMLGCDMVIAFPGGRGTENMVKIAKEASVRVVHGERVTRLRG